MHTQVPEITDVIVDLNLPSERFSSGEFYEFAGRIDAVTRIPRSASRLASLP